MLPVRIPDPPAPLPTLGGVLDWLSIWRAVRYPSEYYGRYGGYVGLSRRVSKILWHAGALAYRPAWLLHDRLERMPYRRSTQWLLRWTEGLLNLFLPQNALFFHPGVFGEQAHRRALRALRRSIVFERPFVMYLRGFGAEIVHDYDTVHHQLGRLPGDFGVPVQSPEADRRVQELAKWFRNQDVFLINHPGHFWLANQPGIEGVHFVYAGDDWRRVVDLLIQRATCILVDGEGAGPGLEYELNSIRRHGREADTVLLSHPDGGAHQEPSDAYQGVLARLEPRDHAVLPGRAWPEHFDALARLVWAMGTPADVPDEVRRFANRAAFPVPGLALAVDGRYQEAGEQMLGAITQRHSFRNATILVLTAVLGQAADNPYADEFYDLLRPTFDLIAERIAADPDAAEEERAALSHLDRVLDVVEAHRRDQEAFRSF